MCIGAQIVGLWLARDLIDAFVDARFSTDPDFRRRVAKLETLEATVPLTPDALRPARRAVLQRLDAAQQRVRQGPLLRRRGRRRQLLLRRQADHGGAHRRVRDGETDSESGRPVEPRLPRQGGESLGAPHIGGIVGPGADRRDRRRAQSGGARPWR